LSAPHFAGRQSRPDLRSRSIRRDVRESMKFTACGWVNPLPRFVESGDSPPRDIKREFDDHDCSAQSKAKPTGEDVNPSLYGSLEKQQNAIRSTVSAGPPGIRLICA